MADQRDMSSQPTYNVFHGDLDAEHEEEHPGYAQGGTLVGARLGTEDLGVTLYIVPPGNANAPYHWHHNREELLLVLSGELTVRTSDWERRLEPGDVVSFPKGEGGAHKCTNESDDAVRYLIFSTKPSIDVVEYPDSGKVAFGSRGHDFRVLRPGASLDYWDGE